MCMRTSTWPANSVGRPHGRRSTESTPLSSGGQSIGRSTVGFGIVDQAVDRRHNSHKNDRWPVDRKGNSALSRLPTGRFFEGYKYAFSWVVLEQILEENFSHLSSVFQQEFLWLKVLILFVIKGWKIQRKKEVFRNWFCSSFLFYPRSFPKYFLCDFDFQTLYFLTLELSYLSYL